MFFVSLNLSQEAVYGVERNVISVKSPLIYKKQKMIRSPVEPIKFGN